MSPFIGITRRRRLCSVHVDQHEQRAVLELPSSDAARKRMAALGGQIAKALTDQTKDEAPTIYATAGTISIHMNLAQSQLLFDKLSRAS